MSKRESDITAVKQTVAAAIARNQKTMKLHYSVANSVTEFASLIPTESKDAFEAMDPKTMHTKTVKVLVTDVQAAIATLP